MAVISSRFKTKKTAGMPSVKGASGIETLASHVENPNAHPEYVKKGSLPEAVNVSEHVADILAHCAGYARRAELLTSLAEYEVAKTRNLAEDANNYSAREGVKRHVVTAYTLNLVIQDLLTRGFGNYIPTAKIVTSTGPEPTSDFDTYVPSWKRFRDLRKMVTDLPESLKEIFATIAYVDAQIGKMFPKYDSAEAVLITSGHTTEDNGWLIWKSQGNTGEAWIKVNGVKVVSITHYREACDIIPVPASATVVFDRMQEVKFYRTSGKKPIRTATVTLSQTSFSCTGKIAPFTYNCCPTAVVTLDGTTLVEGTDYLIGYQNNSGTIDYGTNKTVYAMCVITGIGAYYGTLAKSFAITLEVKAALTAAVISLSPSHFNVSGQVPKSYSCEPVPTVSLAGRVLTLGTDYRVEYSENTGTVNSPVSETRYGTVKVIGIGQYTGTRLVQFEIIVHAVSTVIDINTAVIDLAKSSYNISGALPVAYDCKPKAVVRTGEGLLVEGVDYMVTYSDNAHGSMDEIGTRDLSCTATIYGINCYKSNVTKPFTVKIVAKKNIYDANVVKSPLSFNVSGDVPTSYTCRPTVVVTDGGDTLVAGTHYTVEYSDNSIGAISEPFVGTLTARVIIRGIETAGYTGEEVTDYPINISVMKDLSGGSVTLDHTSYDKTGHIPFNYECQPVPTVVVGGKVLVKDTDYTVVYSTNSRGTVSTETDTTITCSCTINGIGAYSGTITTTYTVHLKSN